ncbi:MAG: hypothetical protein Cons2KO_34320 [Congregibacter sp.]
MDGDAYSLGSIGGRAVSQLRIGDQCFEVIEADPLTPGSVEQWYARECD